MCPFLIIPSLVGLGGDPGWGKEILGVVVVAGGRGDCYTDLCPEGARPPFLRPSNKLNRQTERSLQRTFL